MGILFDRIVDDAALFPPAREPMARALPGYRDAAGEPMLGRFLCPASKLAELRAHLVPEDLIELTIIADTGADRLPEALDMAAAEPRVRLGSLEIALPAGANQARSAAVTIAVLPPDLPCNIEVRPEPGWREALDRLSAARSNGIPLGAKLRTGQRAAEPGGEYGPPPADVAAFVAACAERSLPFKCTAGLHNAVRHLDAETGLIHHGFLNILVATARAATGSYDLEAVLGSEDGGALAAEAAKIDDPAAQATRQLFVGFGSCDIESPRTDLIKLGLAGNNTVS